MAAVHPQGRLHCQTRRKAFHAGFLRRVKFTIAFQPVVRIGEHQIAAVKCFHTHSNHLWCHLAAMNRSSAKAALPRTRCFSTSVTDLSLHRACSRRPNNSQSRVCHSTGILQKLSTATIAPATPELGIRCHATPSCLSWLIARVGPYFVKSPMSPTKRSCVSQPLFFSFRGMGRDQNRSLA